MKKLLFAFAAAASFAALAADPTPGANDIDVLGFEGFNLADPTVTGAVVNRTDTGIEGTSKWSCSGDDASLVKTYGNDNAAKGSGLSYPAPFEDEGDNYLALDTNGSELQRTIPAANQAVAADGTYIDTLVQFTPSESAPTSADLTGAKLAIWLGVENNVTNLYVQGASYTQPTAGDPSTFSFQDAVAYKLSGTYQPGTWYRLTVKAVQSLIDGMPGYYLPGFIIMIDGDELTTDVNAYDANAYSFLTTAQDMGGTPITLVSATNKKLLDDKVFVPALGVAAMTDAPTLTAVGFKGTGALDDFVVTTEAPEFEPAGIDFTLTWPAGLTAVSYQIGNNDPVSLEGKTSGFKVPGLAADDVVKFIVANADGAQKTLTGTAGTDTGLDATGTTFGWPEYLGEAVNGAYEIDDLDELILFQKGVAAGLATVSTTFKLTDDVTLTAPWPGVGLQNGKDLWSPASGTPAADVDIATNNYINGAFKGTFDGQNHTISGFQMQGGGLDYCGFFNSIYGATICNLKIAYAAALFAPDTTGSSAESGGTFVGVTGANSTLRNLTTAAGTVSCSKGFGGIVGYLSDGSLVEYCTNNVNMTSLKPNKCGGIAMIVQRGAAVTVRNCQNNGTIAGSNETGSLIGYIGLNVTIADCESTVAYKLMHHQGNTVTVQGTIKGNATVDSYSGQATPGLNFATVDGSVATFVADEALAAGNTYKAMHTATATYEFAAAGSISFDTNLIQAVTFAITAAQGLDAPTETTENGVVTFTVAGGAEFADDGAEDLLDENTTVTADDVATYVADVTGETAPTTVTKPMVLSYLLKANKILTTPEAEVIKITSIEQVSGGWKITVAAALNATDVAAGATVDMYDITGTLAVTATADLGTAFAPVASANFTVADGEVAGTAVITVTDANAKFLKATVTK